MTSTTNSIVITPPASLDSAEVFGNQRAAMAAIDVSRFGAHRVLPAELLCEALDVHPGERILDVAGAGVAAIAAARRWAVVTATDEADQPLADARRIADACGLPLVTRVADARHLPYPDDFFDIVMSTFGLIFVADHQGVADELIRVCRPDGRIGLVSWCPGSLIGDVLATQVRHAPPPSGIPSAIEWGSEHHVRALFGNRIRSFDIAVRQVVLRYPSSERMLDALRMSCGPTPLAFTNLDPVGQEDLADDLLTVGGAYNRATDGTFVAPSDYAEIVAVVR
jgi:SAM-dependent methyltransferase